MPWISMQNRWTWRQGWRKRSPPAEERGQSPARGELPGGGYESSSTLAVDPTRRAGNSRKTLLNGGKNACCTIWIDATDTDIAIDVATNAAFPN
jgi:hypothetical protein